MRDLQLESSVDEKKREVWWPQNEREPRRCVLGDALGFASPHGALVLGVDEAGPTPAGAGRPLRPPPFRQMRAMSAYPESGLHRKPVGMSAKCQQPTSIVKWLTSRIDDVQRFVGDAVATA
jgi:hypothetical protein